MRKHLNLFKTLADSIDNNTTRKRLFVPTFGSIEAVAFWFGLVVFLSLYGILVQFDRITSLQHFGLLFFDFFLVQFLVIFSIIGYTHLSIASYQSLSIIEQSKRITLTALFFTPIATLLGKFIEILLGLQEAVAQNIFLEAGVNTVLAIILTPLLLYYFGWQYAKILSSQRRYHQKLIQQNLDLKARITPHFFFNMLDTLQYLCETDRAKSHDFLESIVKLYRVSFVETTEISLYKELDLCEHYLKVEQYRFGEKLKVHWQLPDEDTRYDIAIPSLMIQMTIEKLILTMLETTTQAIDLTIRISYQNNWVTVVFIAELPISHQGELSVPMMDVSPQRIILQQFYGEAASIDTRLQADSHVNKCIIQIGYPFTTLSN